MVYTQGLRVYPQGLRGHHVRVLRTVAVRGPIEDDIPKFVACFSRCGR